MRGKNIIIILTFLFLMIYLSETVSAANLTVNPGDSIQTAVNNASTGDTIIVNDNNGSAYTYTENIVINKNISLNSASNNTVKIQSHDSSKPTITVNINGSGSSINCFKITGGYEGILLNSTSGCTISRNIISENNCYGIKLSNSSDNNISGNELGNDQCYGLYLSASDSNEIQNNNIFESCYAIYVSDSTENQIHHNCLRSIMEYPDSTGITLENSPRNYLFNNIITKNQNAIWLTDANNTHIFSNIITDNYNGIEIYDQSTSQIYDNNLTDTIIIRWGPYVQIYKNTISGGIYVEDASVDIHFNTITGTSYGLEKRENGVVNATNNWWGTNNPTVSSNGTVNIKITGGIVFYDPWLVLNVIAAPTTTDNNSIVTADLTHNSNGVYTSSQGHILNGIPINFTTNLGTITTTAYTNNGKANTTFNRGSATSGTATITATLDEQTAQTNITINNADSTAPTVTANLAGGTYNTTKSVTLTASDNLDPNPIVYYSLNNGTTWSNHIKTVTLNLNQGVTNLKFYARDATGNTCSNQTLSYTIDITAPTVVANPASGTYNTTKSVTLTATDNLDPNPTIYYTTNGSTPTISSIIYTYPINVVSTTTLKFMAVDAAGNQAAVQTQNYIISLVINTNTGKSYSKIQDAINDPLTLNNHTIEIKTGTYSENVVVDKKLIIKPASGCNVIVQALNPLQPVFRIYSSGNGTIIQGLTIKGATNSSGIYAVSASEFNILQNTFTDNHIGIYLSSSQNGNLTGNIFTNNTFGFAFLNSDSNLVDNNTITGNYHGMRLGNSNYNLIQSNVIKNSNSGYGIGLEKSNYNTLIGNILFNNYNGIYIGLGGNLVGNCSNNLVINNNITENGNCGVYSYNCTSNMVYKNNLTGNYRGVYISSSDNNLIQNNNITNNNYHGIALVGSNSNNTIRNNYITNGRYGIFLSHSNNATITGNSITGSVYGINPQYSTANIHFNRITDSSRFSLVVQCNSTINATNNWWGTNTPSYIYSANWVPTYYDIYNCNSTTYYNPWLVVNLTGSVIHVTKNSTSQSEITADITHNNQGEDTSSSGTIPDDLPVNFTTTLGTINTTATTKRGKATVTLTSNPTSGAATVSATLDDQTLSKSFRKSFNSIQEAVNDPLTVNGDIIVVSNGTYVENIIVNKKLYIVSDGNVTVQAANPSISVFTINTSGSGSLIQGFSITNANLANSYESLSPAGILLSSTNNCTIWNNTIKGNCYGVYILDSSYNLIIENIIQNNEQGVIIPQACESLEGFLSVACPWPESEEELQFWINEYYSHFFGIWSMSIFNNINYNKIRNNTYHGIYTTGEISPQGYNNLISNDIIGNAIGIFRGITAVIKAHFNHIAENNLTGFCMLMPSPDTDVSNNWWGSNNPSMILNSTGENINADFCYIGLYPGTNYLEPLPPQWISEKLAPWLISNINPTSYKVSDGRIYEATITVDLTHNNNGDDISLQGCVPDNIPVHFVAQYGTIPLLQHTKKGKASSNLVLDPTIQSITGVIAVVDNEGVLTVVDPIAKAFINVVGSGLNTSHTSQNLNFTYEIPLNDSSTWVSVLWKETSLFHGEVDLIVNGVIVKSCNVVNAAYLTYQNSYSEKVFQQIKYVNGLFLNPVGSTTFVPNQYLQPIITANHLENFTVSQLEDFILFGVKLQNNFTDNEINFIKNHRYEFIDLVGFGMFYPGDAAQTISFVDPDNNETISINFPGNPVFRISSMIYFDGYMEDVNGTLYDVGYEGVRSFAIATTKVTNEVVQYWLDKQSLYAPGAMKAAYGTFLTSLLVIKCHDMVADQAASEFNVTWSRTTPVVVSCCDDAASSYITGEMDHRMGMDVNGTPGNVWAFRFACSSAFSPIEQEIGNPNGTIGSVTMGIGEQILNGETPELFYSNGYIIYKIKDQDDLILLLDPTTGIVRDVANGITGAYCYHNQITNNRIEQAENITSSDPSVQPEWMDSISNSTIPLGSIIAVIGEVVAQGTVETFGGVSLSTIIGYCVPILLPAATIQLLDNLRPGAIEEAESNGSFNTAEYFRNNNSWDIAWDVMLQSIGMGGPPTDVFDESNEYIRNNENVKRNLQDMKNLKESALAVWNELYDNLSCPYDRYKYEKAKLEWEEEYDTALSQPPIDPLGQFLVKLVKESVKKCASGITKIKEGDIVGGAIDLALGTAGFDIVTVTILYEAWPKKPEVPGNNSTNNTSNNSTI